MKTVTILIVGFTSYVVIGTLFEAFFFCLYNICFPFYSRASILMSIFPTSWQSEEREHVDVYYTFNVCMLYSLVFFSFNPFRMIRL